MKGLLLLALLMHSATMFATERVVATLTDPAGDDQGDGSLIYPARPEFRRGDLDLTSLRIVQVGDAYRFEATFRNPIRSPVGIVSDTSSDQLSNFARYGFYSFNLDLYFDQDRIQGSGNTFTLPGRGARLDPASAWERAVVLTPRPQVMRTQLIDAAADAQPERAKEIEAAVDRMVHFATQIRVSGRTVSFSVPAAFLAAPAPDTQWVVTAVVTGAKTTIEADLNLLKQGGSAVDRLALGAMQPESGRPVNSFGYSGLRAPLPIVDLVAPTVERQRELLAREATIAGLPLSPAAVATAPGMAQPAAGLLMAAGVRAGPPPSEPAPVAAPAAVATTPVPAAAPAAPPPVAAPAAAATSPARAQPAAPAVVPTPVAPATPARGSIAERLQALKQLFDQKLIDEAEYKQQRQRILNEL
ncbi:MAG: glucodextranase DOMON-like domain-containing protein [Burkholderiaceae bacterium]|nr:glucodextranase DOMON-like domain-containing protein [Burkholderiaceae bacterium]